MTLCRGTSVKLSVAKGAGNTSRPLTTHLSKQGVAAMQSNERWLPVPGFEGLYEVSDQGRVRSVDRVVVNTLGYRHTYRGKIRVPRTDRDGYLRLNLTRGAERVGIHIHRLVLETFVGPRPEGMFSCHFNDIKTDNRVENLRWDSSSANTKDSIRNGTNHNSRKTHCKRGHEFTEENTHRGSKGERNCVQCLVTVHGRKAKQ
jgi:hypothetical protein